ncbi:aldo/keto reductase [Swingsia samuiensis]|uniref:Aldo/keto reductase n=1 Tax=Swingsia samuiensis TaxID=1293412 RepID=A0A4Y6UGI8_9PROT|nr:aldo/keto reductase [Swingsia samuiensis]QDH16679.1 aldo/keto reductase [Swingsia samuiensis]
MAVSSLSKQGQNVIVLNDGHEMPQLGLGVWRMPESETAQVVRKAVEIGYRLVDTAYLYRNEQAVGEALKDRPDVFLTSKVWNDSQGYDETLRAYEKSTKLLGRSILDLYLIHWPMPDQGLYVETWKALVELKKEGRVKSIGVSNFQPDHLKRIMDATGVAPVVNQIEVHPSFQQRDVRAFNTQHHIYTEAWRPLGKGNVLDNPVVVGIAQRVKKTPAQVVLRWHVQNDLIVIPKTVNEERLKENFSIFDFELSREDMQAIAQMDRADGRMGAHPDTAKF